MKTITIRELHERTGEYIRKAAEAGEIYVSRRKLTAEFRKLMKSDKLAAGTDARRIVSDDRERPVR
jgi:hypothetical protein